MADSFTGAQAPAERLPQVAQKTIMEVRLFAEDSVQQATNRCHFRRVDELITQSSFPIFLLRNGNRRMTLTRFQSPTTTDQVRTFFYRTGQLPGGAAALLGAYADHREAFFFRRVIALGQSWTPFHEASRVLVAQSGLLGRQLLTHPEEGTWPQGTWFIGVSELQSWERPLF